MRREAYTEINGAKRSKRYREVPETFGKTKAEKQEAKESMTVTVGAVEFDANAGSVGYMSAVGALAAWQMAQTLLGNGAISQDEYDAVYLQSVPWRGADNLSHSVPVETVLQALRSSMERTKEIIGLT